MLMSFPVYNPFIFGNIRLLIKKLLQSGEQASSIDFSLYVRQVASNELK